MSENTNEAKPVPCIDMIHQLANLLTMVQTSAILLDKSIGVLLSEEDRLDLDTIKIKSEDAVKLLHELRKLCTSTGIFKAVPL